MEVTRRQIGSVLVLAFAEPLQLEGDTSDRFKEWLKSEIGDGDLRLVMDLGRVEFIDSAGLGALISCFKMLRANGGDMKLANVPGPVRTVFEITRLLRVFDTYPTVEEAMKSLESADVKAGA